MWYSHSWNNMTFTANIIMLNIKMQKQHDFSAIFCHVIYRKWGLAWQVQKTESCSNKKEEITWLFKIPHPIQMPPNQGNYHDLRLIVQVRSYSPFFCTFLPIIYYHFFVNWLNIYFTVHNIIMVLNCIMAREVYYSTWYVLQRLWVNVVWRFQ